MHFVEPIEELALEPLAAKPGILLLQPAAHRLRELVEGFHAERFGKRIIDGDAARRLDRFCGNVELRLFSRQDGVEIVRGKSDLHQPRFPHTHADQLIFEPGKKRSRTNIDADVAAGAALERLAIDPAGKIDDDAIALLGGGALALRCERPVLLGDLIQRLLDLRVSDVGHLALELDAFEIAELDLRENFEGERIGKIGFAADHVLDFGLLARQCDFRLHGELEPAVAHDLGVELADHRLDGLRHDGLAINLFQVRHRHFAGAEAAQLDSILELAETFGDPRIEVGCRHLHLEFAL